MNPLRTHSSTAPARHARTPARIRLAALAIALALAAPAAHANVRCQVPDIGGTAKFPPNCSSGYQSRTGALLMDSGLPGSPILGYMRLENIAVTLETPGGPLGGAIQDFTGEVLLRMEGTGALAGFHRAITITVIGRSFTGPAVPGATVQSFDTDMFFLQGDLPSGDPDFDLLRITAGSGARMPSPGHTTLTQLPNGNWSVDSFFDITYQIDFVGAPGGPLAGLSNTTVSEERLREGVPEPERCIVPDNGAGTVDFPPPCPDGHQSPPDASLALNGPPVGSALMGRISLTHVLIGSEVPGGPLGGDEQSWTCDVEFAIHGTGTFSGYARTVVIPGVPVTSFTGPRGSGVSPETFLTELAKLQEQLPPGDPDFDLLRITAGSSFGLPGRGQATTTLQPSGNWAVDSFFDITYRIDFVGDPGGPFAGMSGSTVASERFHTGARERVDCDVPSTAGTAAVPPECPEGYVSPNDAGVGVDQTLPQSPLIGKVSMHHIHVLAEAPGGPLGGTVAAFEALATFDMYGNGDLVGFRRVVDFPVSGVAAAGPRAPGSPVQPFDTELMQLTGQLPPGDPDFDLLRITAGSGFGMPAPGHTTLRLLDTGRWQVDSFFDITYRIDFVGALGGSLPGLSGSSEALERFEMGNSIDVCVTPDIGGTGEFPPPCRYPGPPNACFISNGMPAGTTLDGTMALALSPISVMPGGGLGGEIQNVGGSIGVQIDGTGAFAGYSRSLSVPINLCETHTAPRTLGDPVQSFDTDMFRLSGQIGGDPDFDLLRITAGTDFAMPSPGHTTFTHLPGGNWAVDSFFDITYRVDFTGAPSGPFAGMSGSTTCSNRFQIGQTLLALSVDGPGVEGLRLGMAVPNPTSRGSQVQLRLPGATAVDAGLFDVSGRRVRDLERGTLEAGDHLIRWDGLDADGRRAAPGLYFYRVKVGAQEFTRKTVVSH